MTKKSISEVIAEIKSAAGKATETHWIVADEDRSDGDDAIVTCELRQGMIEIAKIQGGGSESWYDDDFADQQRANAAFIALMCPENTLRLIDHIAALEQQYERYPLVNQIRVQQERIAELEQQLAAERARVVKLPRKKPLDVPFAGHRLNNSGWNSAIDACRAVLIAAGIPVEGE